MSATGRTTTLPDNQSRSMLDLATLESGDVIEVVTNSSRWHFVLLSDRQVRRETIVGVAVMTNSRTFGQVTRSPLDLVVSRIVRLGEIIHINEGSTGRVQAVCVNSVRYLG